MTKRLKTLISLVFALASASALSQGEDANLRKEVEAIYAKWDKLVAASDLKGMYTMIHPSFVAIDTEGKVTGYEEVKKEIAAAFKGIKEPKSKIKVDNVSAQGDEIVAWITMKVSFKSKKGNKWETVTFSAKMAETLKRFGDQLKFVSSQSFP